jgi:hypothetical protein
MRESFALSLALALTLLLVAAGAATAQIATGNVYGTVADESGGVLPGVLVSLEGEVGTRSTVSGPRGAFRFLRVRGGAYTLNLSLTGFATLTRAIRVTTGEDVEMAFTMKVSAIEETVVVLGEASLVNTKRRGTSTAMTAEELAEVPNARDPWAVLRAVPGVTVSRVNIAGNENGQQDSYTGKGTARGQSNWNLDGVVITDMSATGSSSTYFEFEAFDEIAVTTGGSDLMGQTGGVGINLTTKRGTNRFHGGARFLISHADLSFSNLPSSLDNDSRLENEDGTRRDKADHIQQINDYGFELGGPIVKDKLWFFGTWGQQDIRLVRLIGTPDKTLLPAFNVKVNWQATPHTMVSGLWFQAEKRKYGRKIGFPVQETDSFLVDQSRQSTAGGLPGGIWKLQVDHTFSPDFFVAARLSYNDSGFGLTPRGGMDQSWTIDYYRGVAIGSFAPYLALRPQTIASVDGNYFFHGLGGQNELKFGLAWRDYKTTSGYDLPGNGLVGYMLSATGGVAEVSRASSTTAYKGTYWSAYLGDVLTKDRLSLNFGIRWDWQRAKNLPGEVAANPTFPGLLPALTYPGDEGWPIDWTFWSPRVGLAWGLDDSRRTVVRASYALYGGMLSFGDMSETNPLWWGWLGYPWADLNGDRFVQAPEVDLDNLLYSGNVNLDDPSSGESSNRIGESYKPSRDHELIVGVDHELGEALAVGVAYTWRSTDRLGYRPWLASQCPLVGANPAECRIVQPDEYTPNEPEAANGYSAFTYSPPGDLVAAGQGGRIRTNAAGYRRTYNGLELTLVKRLSSRWMGRVALSWNDWTESWDGTPYAGWPNDGNPTPTRWNPLVQEGQVTFVGAKGSTSNIRWQLYANGLVQLPWGLDASAALFARQGGAYPVSLQLRAGADGTLEALGTDQPDTLRYDRILNLDLRLAKTFTLHGSARVILSAEWFNVFNSDTVLNRFMFANSPSFVAEDMGAIPGQGRIEEIISPSIFRVGARLAF